MSEPLFPAKRRALYVAALVLAAVALAVGATIDSQRRQWWAKIPQQTRANQQAMARAEAALRQLTASLPSGQQPTVRDAETVLNGGSAFAVYEGEYEYQDPVTGGRAHLRIWRDRWLDVHPAPQRRESTPGAWDWFDLARAVIAIPGHFLTLIYLVVVLMDWRRNNWRGRTLAATNLLVISASLLLLTCAGPGLLRNAGSLFGNNPGAWSAGGACLSLLMLGLLWLQRSGPEGYPTCRSCGYNLTGNLSGRCPECGRVIEQTVLAPDQTKDQIA